jgi:hypothetical protein
LAEVGRQLNCEQWLPLSKTERTQLEYDPPVRVIIRSTRCALRIGQTNDVTNDQRPSINLIHRLDL